MGRLHCMMTRLNPDHALHQSRTTHLDLHRHLLRRPRDADVRNPADADLQRDDALPLCVRRAVAGDVRHDGRRPAGLSAPRPVSARAPARTASRVAAVAFPIAMVLSFMTELSIPFRVERVGRRDLRDRLHLRRHRRAVRRQRGRHLPGADRLSRRGQPPLRRRSRRRGARLRAAHRRARLVRRSDGGAVGRVARERRRRRVCRPTPGRRRCAAPRPRAVLVLGWPRGGHTRCSSGGARRSSASSTRRAWSRRARSTRSGTRTRACA